MKLLFVGTRAGGGGTESHMAELATAIAGAGHDVAAVVRPGDEIERALRAGGRVRLFPGRFDRASDPAGTLQVWRAARATSPDWLIGSFKHEYYSIGLVARLLGCRVALFKHTDLPMRRLTAFVLPRISDRFIVPSRFMRAHCIALGMPADRVHVLYNPLDVQRFRPDARLRTEMRSRLGFTDAAVVVGFVGRIEPVKGALVLFDALEAAMHADTRLRALWVGDGVASTELQRRAASSAYAHRHVWLGWIDDPRPYYAALDVLALPSTRSETFGRVCVEAQACGVPVLGSRLGGIGEAIADGATGLLITPGDVAAWRGALLELADPVRRHALARAAPDFVEDAFSAPRIARAFETLLTTGQSLPDPGANDAATAATTATVPTAPR